VTDETPAPDQNTDFSDINANLASGLSSFGADDQTNAGEPDLDQETIDPIDVAESAMNASRERLGTVPAEVVITNHLMGLYELAAIHLSANPPDLVQSALAIDALACLVATESALTRPRCAMPSITFALRSSRSRALPTPTERLSSLLTRVCKIACESTDRRIDNAAVTADDIFLGEK
jgi:hypothetical protein